MRNVFFTSEEQNKIICGLVERFVTHYLTFLKQYVYFICFLMYRQVVGNNCALSCCRSSCTYTEANL